MQNNISGIFILQRPLFVNKVSLVNTKTKELEIVDYFEFEKILKNIFDLDKVNKILDCINNYEKVLIDFNKKIAKLITTKDCDFNNILQSSLNAKTVAMDLEDSFYDSEMLERFKTL